MPVFGIPSFGIPAFGQPLCLKQLPGEKALENSEGLRGLRGVCIKGDVNLPVFGVPSFGILAFGIPVFGIPGFGISVSGRVPLCGFSLPSESLPSESLFFFFFFRNSHRQNPCFRKSHLRNFSRIHTPLNHIPLRLPRDCFWKVDDLPRLRLWQSLLSIAARGAECKGRCFGAPEVSELQTHPSLHNPV